MRLGVLAVVASATVIAVGGTGSVTTAGAASECSRVVAPGGSDGGPGTESSPFRTVRKLVASLKRGQTGCLRAGAYHQNVKVSSAATALRSYPGERARLVGRLWIARSAVGTRITGLDLDGTNSARLPGPTVNAPGVVFEDNDVTNGHRAESCFLLGSSQYGRADRVVIRRNRIHDCGRLPAANHDHGIYAAKASGGLIAGNLIYDNADRGVQLYPDADRFVVTGNVIDGNGQGVIFSGDGGRASSSNRVQGNIITNSRLRFNVESYWPRGNPVGTGNVAERNCLWNGARGGAQGVQSPSVGFSSRANVVGDPRYLDRRQKDFRLAPDSPCRSVLAP